MSTPGPFNAYFVKYKLAKLSHLDLEGYITHKHPHASKLGGHSDVYSAWSTKHEKKVAVKRVRIFMKHDTSFAKKLAKEMRIWAKLDHKCVLPLLGYFIEGEGMLPSLVSEWMDQGTVDVFMASFPRGGEETWNMIAWICSGLVYLHSQGVIHADLKCQNILVSPSGMPLLADFGLSIALSHSVTTTSTFNVRGTTRWMAFELLASDEGSDSDAKKPKHTEKTDVWACGMVIYELLSGRIPYYSKQSDASVILGIVSGELPARPWTKKKYARFADALWRKCEKCWEMRPDRRPTASDLLHNTFKDGGVHAVERTQQHASPVIVHHHPYAQDQSHSTPLNYMVSSVPPGLIQQTHTTPAAPAFHISQYGIVASYPRNGGVQIGSSQVYFPTQQGEYRQHHNDVGANSCRTQ